MLVVGNNEQFARLCRVIGRPAHRTIVSATTWPIRDLGARRGAGALAGRAHGATLG